MKLVNFFVVCIFKQNKNKERLGLYTWLSWKVIIVPLGEPSADSFIPYPCSCSFLSMLSKLCSDTFPILCKRRKYLSVIENVFIFQNTAFICFMGYGHDHIPCHRDFHLALTSRVHVIYQAREIFQIKTNKGVNGEVESSRSMLIKTGCGNLLHGYDFLSIQLQELSLTLRKESVRPCCFTQ